MKKRIIMLKALSVLFSALLVLNSFSICVFAKNNDVYSVAEESSLDYSILNTETDNVYNKIHFYFDDYENTTIDNMDELVEATSKLTDNNISRSNTQRASDTTTSKVELTVQFDSDFMETVEYKAFAQERENLDSIEDVREFRSRLNAFSKEYHNDIIDKNISLLNDFDYNSIKSIGYSPFVVMNIDSYKIDSETLLTVAESESITSISVSRQEKPEAEISWINTLSEINAYDIVRSETYTGDGIRIGVYESKSICDVTDVNLSDKNITVRDATKDISDHATNVTSILALIAPDAEYFVSDVLDVPGIQWFIDMGCDIVNCSFGYYNNSKGSNGLYSDGAKQYFGNVDGVYDYQILAHFITVVNSSGNYLDDSSYSQYNPQNKVTSPGYAHNVITVGGVQRISTSSGYHLEHDPDASYVTPTGCIKPNICAITEVTIPNFGEDSGTSYAAPQVAGCIALLQESNPNYCTYPERTLSLIASTAQKTHDYVEDAGNFNQKVGAGIIDLERMLDSNLYYRASNTNGSSLSEVASVTVSLQEGQTLQTGLAWLATAINNSSTGTNITNVIVTNYDLRVYLPSGSYVYSACSTSNVELVRLTAEEFGNYRIVLYQYGALDDEIDGEWLFLTYNVLNE